MAGSSTTPRRSRGSSTPRKAKPAATKTTPVAAGYTALTCPHGTNVHVPNSHVELLQAVGYTPR